MKNRKYIYIIAITTILLDQFSKLIVQRTMNVFQEINVIPNFFSLVFVKNTGAAFSILEDATVFLVILSVVFLVGLNNYMKKEQETLDKLSILSLGIIIGGVFGNLIDRILYKSVIDFLSFNLFGYDFPIFNMADIGITVGVFLLFLDMWKRRKEE